MSELTSEQFRVAVAAAISGVEHLYREVDLLITGLLEALAGEPEPLKLMPGTLGKSGKEDSKRVLVRHEYGALFEPAPDADDEVDEDEEQDELDGPATTPKAKAGRHEIVAAQPLLSVRIAMFDPRKGDTFEPQIEYAVMSGWVLGDSPTQPDDRFTLQAYMLRRISKALADRAGTSKGARISTGAAATRGGKKGQKGEGRRLSCALPAGVEAVPLYSISSAESLEQLAERMKAMWISVVGA